jgi:hypothetical protein
MLEGKRKLTACLVAVISATGLVWFGKIGDGVYSTVMLAAVCGYLAANATQAIGTAVKS